MNVTVLADTPCFTLLQWQLKLVSLLLPLATLEIRLRILRQWRPFISRYRGDVTPGSVTQLMAQPTANTQHTVAPGTIAGSCSSKRW